MVVVIVIFFISSGFFKCGGKKYNKLIPVKEAKLPNPVTKVLSMPSPNIGKTFSKEKFFLYCKKS